MNKDFFKQLITFEQAANDFASGVPISIYFQDRQYVIVALSCITFQDFKVLSNFYKPVKLVISKYRARFLGVNTEENLLLDISDLTFDEITDYSGISYKNLEITNYLQDSNFFDHLILLSCNLGIVPSFVLFEAEDISNFREYTALEVTLDNHELQLSFREISRASLKIRNIKEKLELVAFKSNFANKEHYAIIIGDIGNNETPLVRLHSSCYTGDLLGSITCDCYDQLHAAIDKMVDQGGGIILYLMQEGRGIGLSNKLRCYSLQNDGLDTVDANLAMGFPDDARIMWPAAQMLRNFGISSVKLLTNNPKKKQDLENYGIKVIETIKHIAHSHTETDFYMETKAKRMGHKL